MNIMIEASGCKAGGGVQVADSVCRNLYRYPQHKFVVVLSNRLAYLEETLKHFANVIVEYYTSGNNLRTLITGRDSFLDNIVERYNIQAVEFIFGPSLWIPKIMTISGFAMGHLVLQDSPFWKTQPLKKLLPIRFRNWLHARSFKKLSNCYYTENPFITERLKKLLPGKRVETITNTCHQVFDNPNDWNKNITLPQFDGFTLLTISAPYPHKNLAIIPKVLGQLEANYPNLEVRFVLTCDSKDIPEVEEKHKNKILFIGRVEIDQCPWLYTQSDALFLPTMMECFSANYVEAMKMNIPILTSDLGFAKGLCEEAALYFDPIDPTNIANVIHKLSGNKDLRNQLVSKGIEQLKKFDTQEIRADKIIALIEDEYNKTHK